MFALLRAVSSQQLLIEQLPALLVAIFIAENFYKFRSFTLECVAFLVTWYVTDAILTQVYKALVRAGVINDPRIVPAAKD
ncbi:MAG: hypothetical protein K8L97_07395 [Anaerolineae bacterium]|nr:hypothetical protein [Anaerolineae bacterium]